MSMRSKWRLLGGAALAAVALTACTAHTSKLPRQTAAYQQPRLPEITAMREYRQCRDEAIALDRQARQASSPARYLASARLLERCEAGLGPNAAQLAREERMRAYGLSIQNYLKSGDLAKARTNLQRLRQKFPGTDLYYADGSSFVETMGLLLNRERRETVGEFALLNVNGDLKAELRRVRYWTRN